MIMRALRVVLYLSSTSNHNLSPFAPYRKDVVLYLSSTSNHNQLCQTQCIRRLCYIFLLHQTTTSQENASIIVRLCYIFLLHQTTTDNQHRLFRFCCVISFFYIKPQPSRYRKDSGKLCYIFLLHQTTTGIRDWLGLYSCVISFFYIKPQLMSVIIIARSCCVISFFYIKPQPSALPWLQKGVVLYLSSTSNHNWYSRLAWSL